MKGHVGILAIALCMAVASAVSQDTTGPGPIHAPKTTEFVIDFGTVGLFRGQTARLTAVAVDPPEPDLPPGPCRVELSFVFANGAETDPKPFELRGGESAYIELDGDRLEHFLLIRGKVSVRTTGRQTPPDPCRAGIELIDNTSRQTKVFVSPAEIRGFNPQPDPPGKQGRVPPGADRGFNPQPDPPGFPMLGLARGQTLRVHVANVAVPGPNGTPPDPCRTAISFVDGQGNLLVPAVQKVIEAGKTEFVSLDENALIGLLNVPRVDLRARVTYYPPDPGRGAFPPGPCIPVASLELVDNATGQSSLFVSPATIRGFNPQPDPPGTPPIVPGLEKNR